ncbi:MAG: MscL family protein [Bacilli bacterium]|nr:MscL family protein [Bacilli bacterium]
MAKKEKGKLWKEFKAFINKGNAFMLAVGVVIGGAFNAIVTALVNILMSVATWAVPGGLKGLVTVLPALNDAQKGASFQGASGVYNAQFFATSDVNTMTVEFAKAQGVTITPESDTFIQWKNSLLGLYDLHGTTYTYKMSAVIDWGSFINAIISFLIIAITLFIIVKVMAVITKKNEEVKAKALEAYYEKHPEERPVPPEPGKPEPTTEELLGAILIELKTQNGTLEPAEEAKAE